MSLIPFCFYRLCHPVRHKVLIAAAVLLSVSPVRSQDTPPTAPSPDASVVGASQESTLTPAQLSDQAWKMLTDSVASDKRPEARIQGLAALGILGGNPRSLRLIHDATSDRDLDVRTAAVLASGQTRSPNVTTDLRQMLDDREPQVAFTAAVTLWKLHDHSGEDILVAVASGGRSASPRMMKGAEHSLSKQLHNPAALARDGVLQGASMLLGPFGMGLTALEYLRKNGGDNARVEAIGAIAENHTAPIRETLLASLDDKDFTVRAAAAKALAEYRESGVAAHLARLFNDPKPPVRLTAAAAYLACSERPASHGKAAIRVRNSAQ